MFLYTTTNPEYICLTPVRVTGSVNIGGCSFLLHSLYEDDVQIRVVRFEEVPVLKPGGFLKVRANLRLQAGVLEPRNWV